MNIYKKASKSKLLGIIILFLINTIVISLFLFRTGIVFGWDTQFHLNRIEGLYKSIISGHVIPSNGTFAFSSIGLAVNKFYPYLFLYPFALFRLFLNPVTAYNVCLSLIIFLSLIISFLGIYLMRRSTKFAFFFSLFYNNSSYLLLQITQRGDIAEYIALAFLPLLFCGFWELLMQPDSKMWLLLPISMGLIIYSHLLSCILFTGFLTIMLVVYYRNFLKNSYALKRLVMSIGLVVIITLPVSVNFVSAELQNKVTSPAIHNLANEALLPSTLIINSINNAIPKPLTDVNLGILVLTLALIGGVSLLPRSQKNTNKLAMVFELVGILMTICSTRLFPWSIFQTTPLNLIQFPWRLLGVATFCFSFSAAFVVSQININRAKQLIIFITICMLSLNYVHAFVHFGNPIVNKYQEAEYQQLATNAVYTDYMPVQMLKGYDRLKVDRMALPIHQHIAKINGRKVKLKDSQIRPGYNKITYSLILQKNKLNKIELPLLNYGRNYSTASGTKVYQTSQGTTLVEIKPSYKLSNVTIYVK